MDLRSVAVGCKGTFLCHRRRRKDEHATVRPLKGQTAQTAQLCNSDNCFRQQILYTQLGSRALCDFHVSLAHLSART